MKVYLNEISGLWQAVTAMYMSKRSWTREREVDIQDVCFANYYIPGGKRDISKPLTPEMDDYLKKLFKWAPKHTTLGRFIDFAFTVEGMHRGAQDDFDSHAMRLNSRIIRSSTRLASFGGTEKSSYYDRKILTPDEALALLAERGISLPTTLYYNGYNYVRAENGYVREDLANDQDVRRGLYPLCIPSNFTFRVNSTDFAHIVKQRDRNSHAHPELREAVEEMKRLIQEQIPYLTEDYWYSVSE